MPEQAGTQGTPAPTSPASGTSNGLTSGANGASNGAAFALPPDIAKQYPTLAKFKDLPSLAKSYGELEKSYGSALRVPGPEATDEERSAFYSKLGRPESPDKYEIKFAEGTQIDDTLLSNFRATAHKLGLSQATAQSLAEWWAGQAQGMGEAQGNQINGDLATWDKELTTDWGWQKERNIGLAARAFNAAVDGTDLAQPLTEFFNDTGLGNHPLMIKFFHALALKNGEDKLITAEGPTADDRQTAGEQIRAIRGDKDHPYNNPKHPSHQDAMRHMKALYDTMYAKEG